MHLLETIFDTVMEGLELLFELFGSFFTLLVLFVVVAGIFNAITTPTIRKVLFVLVVVAGAGMFIAGLVSTYMATGDEGALGIAIFTGACVLLFVAKKI